MQQVRLERLMLIVKSIDSIVDKQMSYIFLSLRKSLAKSIKQCMNRYTKIRAQSELSALWAIKKAQLKQRNPPE